MIAHCKYCGAEFIAGGKRIYCSKKCQRKAQHKKESVELKTYKTPTVEHKPSKLDEKLRKYGCVSYAERQKAETLRLIREGIL